MLLTSVLAAALLAGPADTLARPVVVAHRGASGHRPEHTLEAYRLAVAAGADFIELDLVSTRDGVLVARHENELSGTTDVAAHPEFAGRRTTKLIDGREVAGWFAEDFTLAELRTLRARERLPRLRPGSAEHDGRYGIPTLQEVIGLAKRESAARGRTIGIYPETKHPTYFDSIGLSLEEPLLRALERAGWTDAEAPVFVQSFETGNLRELRRSTGVRLVQLLAAEGRPYDLVRRGDSRTYADLATAAGLAEIATYADGIGPAKELVVPRDSAGSPSAPTTLVADAHAAGLVVHPWTFRSENHFLPAGLRRGDPAGPAFPREHGAAAAEYRLFEALGVDGFFSDFPAEARAALHGTAGAVGRKAPLPARGRSPNTRP
ncbi:MAG: glycerophosphodiester phosphodiesterase [Gemmatimonadota bacterium]